MSGIATAVVAGSVITGYMSSEAQSDAASTASDAQAAATRAQIQEQRRQFDAIQKLLKPYTASGTDALRGYENIIGLNGTAQQAKALRSLQSSPEFTSLVQQGENAILQNASATGGLRGGNVQAALAQFRPQMLNQVIEQQLGRFGNLIGIGQNAAAGVGNAGMNSANQISEALGQQGAAQAGAALAQGQAQAQMWGNIGSSIGNVATLKALKVF